MLGKTHLQSGPVVLLVHYTGSQKFCIMKLTSYQVDWTCFCCREGLLEVRNASTLIDKRSSNPSTGVF